MVHTLLLLVAVLAAAAAVLYLAVAASALLTGSLPWTGRGDVSGFPSMPRGPAPSRAAVPGVPASRRLRDHGVAVLGVVAVTVFCGVTGNVFSDADRALLYILGVVLTASFVSRGPALVHVLLAVAAFNFFFVEPRFTFHVADHAFLVTFAVMLVVGFAVSTLTVRIREEAGERAAARVIAETERTRSELLSAVSHDLRTPLASIAGAAGELLAPGDALPPAERRELLETIRAEGERLRLLVDGLLELTRLESGTFQPTREWCPVEEIVGSALGRLESRLEGRRVEVDLPEEVLLVPVDAVLLEHVLVNLVENAHKYAPAGTAVDVRVRRDGGEALFEVLDRGPGLDPGEEERIFDRFIRGSARGAAGGWGLGLAIGRAIVRVHGGSIEARPREGGGAVFRFRIPLRGGPPGAGGGGEGAA